MAFLRPSEQFDWIRADAPDLERKLQQGDGMGWPGDPRLTLAQGVIEAGRRQQHPVTGKWLNPGDIVARRWEVWRFCEDGVDRKIGTWRMEEFDRILLDLAPMRLDSPGHVDAEVAIDAANAEIERAATDDWRDNAGEMLEHAAKLHHDRNEPNNVFRGMPGLRDDPPVTTPVPDAGE